MSREYPDRPMVGVGVVVWRGPELLLIQRGKPPRAGSWSLPGGMQELGETVRETAAREVREETGVEITVTHLIDVVDTITRDEDGRVRMQYTLVDFAAEWRSGEAVAGSDAAGVRWIHPNDLGPLKLWKETLRVIEMSAAAR
ncbi:MAG: NUDIX domain-containing protein [Alphaproteobacteria bacterium]|nr:NUDIX domain-containing protein [Alphaproteobacteria bacterium]